MPTVFSSQPVEYLVERSRFIGQTFRLTGSNDLMPHLDALKAQYPGANHYTWAYRIHSGNMRASDQGEPQGTAGLPMLHILEQQHWEETLVVVIRYFGGIKLGRGGLIRAYQETAQRAITKTEPGRIVLVRSQTLEIGYPHYERVRHAITPLVLTLEATFNDQVALHISLEDTAGDRLTQILYQEIGNQWRITDEHQSATVIPMPSSDDPLFES